MDIKTILEKFNSAKTEDECQDAILLIQHLAENGNLDAQVELGLIYDNGQYVKRNLKTASNWFLSAANMNSARAQYNYGICLYYGDGVPKDERQSALWIKKAASQNCVRALLCLSMFYYNGDCGFMRDESKAIEILEKAKTIAVGNRDDEFLIYDNLMCGKSGEINITEAIEWCTKSAKSGHKEAYNELGILYENNSIKGEIKDAIDCYKKSAILGSCNGMYNFAQYLLTQDKDEEALEWLKIGSIKRHTNCVLLLASFYDPSIPKKLKSIRKDANIAIKLYTIAAEKECAAACERLAGLYFEDCVNYKLCIDYCHKSIKYCQRPRNDFTAEYYLAQCYYNGFGIEKNYDAAISYLTMSANGGLSEAQEMLGSWFNDGINGYLEKNFKMAFLWFQKAAEQGKIGAIVSLSIAYWNGYGVEICKEKAFELMHKAAKLGSEDATFNLGIMYSRKYEIKNHLVDLRKSVRWYLNAAKNNYTPSYWYLSLQIEKCLNFDNIIDEDERIKLEIEAMKILGKAIVFNKKGLASYDDINYWGKLFCIPQSARYNKDGSSTKKLPTHTNVVPFNRIIIYGLFTLRTFIESKRIFTIDEILYMAKQLCTALMHYQDNNFVVFKCNLENIYIALPRSYEIQQINLQKIKYSLEVLCCSESKLSIEFPLEILKMIVDYLPSTILNNEDIESDIFLRSRLFLGEFNSCISFPDSSLILTDCEKPIIRRKYVAPEVLGKRKRNFANVNSYTLGIILKRLLEHSNVSSDSKIRVLVSDLIRPNPRSRIDLQQAFKNIISYSQ